ncbi:Hemolymph clottable protein [Armadillidium vulgare]|nr:Hemolymph clottable protein [Armadillidium vulgare]
MKILITLLAFVGISWALIPGTEYRYHYEGKIRMGLPEIRNKYSGAGIKTTVIVQVLENKKVMFKFNDIQVGEFLGDVGMKIMNPMPMKYVPLKREAKVLEEPFEVNFVNYQKEEIVVPKSDIEWIVNIRKSVVQLFLNEPIRGNFGFSNILNKEKTTFTAFSIYEPTIFGTCSIDYTIVPTEVSTNDINMEQTTMNKDVYMLTRTINFDKCHDKVSFMFGNVGNLTNMTNTMFGGVSTRSSVMSLKLVGKPGHFVIYEGSVKGLFSLNTFGSTSDKLMYITNQTFFLESTKKITKTLVVPTPNRIIKTIYPEIWSPFKAPVNPVPFINYYNKKDAFYTKFSDFRALTGIPIPNEQVQNYKNFLNDLIHEAAQLTLSVTPMTNMKVGPMNKETNVITLLEKATYFSLLVDITELERVFETYYNDKSELGQMKMKLFIDVCATSGYYPIKVLVNEMKRGRITPERITSIFTTFVNTFAATPLLQDIMSYVKTLDFKTNPVMTSNVIINFATILKKSCVDYLQGMPEYFGAEKCDMRIITDQFIPFLKQLFETSTDIFERRSITKALSNLRTTEAINFIFEIATGNYAVEVREFAIFGLRYRNVKNIVRKDDIFNTLMPIVQNIKEDPYLRQVAITVLISFRPSPTWWQRLSASTWREPSKSVGSFIYYLIKSYTYNKNTDFGTEERIANFLLPITKPYPPSSTYSYVYGKTLPEEHFKVLYDSTIYKDDTMDRPRNVYTKYFHGIDGYTFPLFETMFMRNSVMTPTEPENSHWSRIFSDKLKTMDKAPSSKIVKDIYSEMMKMMNQKMSSSSKLDSTFFTIFENLQAIFPLSLKTTKEKFDFFASLMRGRPLGLTKFFDAMECSIYFPTEIGLPFYATFNSPILFSAEGDVKLNMEGAAENIFNPSTAFTVDLSTNFKFISKFVGKINAITPWNEKIISSGIETSKTLNIPVRISTMIEYNGNFKNISLEVTPKYNKEFTAVSISNIPFVRISKAYPESVKENGIFEVVSVGQNEMGEMGLYKNNYVINRENTGIDGVIRFNGDIPYPFTYGNFYKFFNNPSMIGPNIMSRTAKYFRTEFVFNFGTSETKAFYPSFAFREESSFVMSLFMKGTKTRYFESNFQTKVLSRDAETKRTEFVYKYIRQLPGMKPQVFCVNVDTKTPIYNDYKTLFKLLSTNIDYTFVGKVRGGYSCKESQLATLKGSFKVSDEMKQTLIDKVTKEMNINKYSKIENKFETMYDRVQVLVEYKEPLPEFFTNMTYQTYDILRGSQFPYIYNNYYNVKNPKGRIFIEGERYIDETYNLRVQLPTENVNMDYFKIPFLYKFKMIFFAYNAINEIPVVGLFNDILF